MVQQAFLGLPEQWGRRAPQEGKVNLAWPRSQAPRGLPEVQVRREQRGPGEPLDRLVLRGFRVQLDRLVPPGFRVPLDRLVPPGFRVPLARLVPPGPLEAWVRLVTQGPPELPQRSQGLQAVLARRVHHPR